MTNKIPINGPYYKPEELNKINKSMDKIYNKMVDITTQTPRPWNTARVFSPSGYAVPQYTESKNILFSSDGSLRKIGYKSLAGFIRILKSQNKSLKKLGVTAQFLITLPIKEK